MSTTEWAVVKEVRGRDVIVTTPAGEFSAAIVNAPGDNATPLVGDTVAVIRTAGRGKRLAFAYYDPNVEPTAAGGRVVYSRDADGNVTASVELTPDGVVKIYGDAVELNGDGKSLVTHAELNTALQAMLAALNANFALKLDGGGAAGVTTLDISSAATTTIKTDG